MSPLHTDIETVPDTDLPEDLKPECKYGNLKDEKKREAKKKEWEETGLIKDMSCEPRMFKIICIEACGKDGKFLWDSWEMTEKEQLEQFWKALETKGFDLVQGFGISHFDVPGILQRSLLLGVLPTMDLSNTSKYKRSPVYDSQMVLSPNNQPEKGYDLNWYCKRYGLPEKTGKGSEVYQMFLDGKLKEISSYCRDDVLSEKALYEKIIKYYPVPRNYDREKYES